VKFTYLEDERYVLVVTEVGVRCGFDQSAYVYEWRDDHWRILTVAEQNNYDEKTYGPWNFLAIRVSTPAVAWNEPAAPPLILTLALSPWCSSNWNELSTRLWRASLSNSSPKPLVDTSDELYRGDYEVAEGSLTPHDAVIEFEGRSIDEGSLIRRHVVHYRVEPRDKVRRIAPVALSPDAFVDEWLSRPWADVAGWTDDTREEGRLRRWHRSSRQGAPFGDLEGPPTRCRRNPTLWQVGFSRETVSGSTVRTQPTDHFLVRWTPPYRFSMVRIQKARFRGCSLKVDMPDDLGTLFPLQDYRR
jgi:hypothetical protein